MTPSLVHHFLERAARERPAHAFLIEGNETTTYAALDDAAEQMARGLLARGLERGDRVGLLAPNSRFYVQAYFAILKAGGVVVPLNTANSAEMLAQDVQRVAKGRPGVRRIELRPEQRQQHVPAVPRSGRWRSEIGEQRQAFRLAKERVDRGAIARGETDLAEQVQLDHPENDAAVG